MHITLPSTLAALATTLTLGLVSADSHCDTRYGTTFWPARFQDENACGHYDYGSCYPTYDQARALLFDQLSAAFDNLCQDVSCEGSYAIYTPGSGCSSTSLDGQVAFTLSMDAEYTYGDRDAVKEAYMNTMNELNHIDYDCNIDSTSGVQFEYINFPTDMNIVKDDGGGGLRYYIHINLNDGGESACDVINDIWGAIGGSIPGGNIFGLILQGACR